MTAEAQQFLDALAECEREKAKAIRANETFLAAVGHWTQRAQRAEAALASCREANQQAYADGFQDGQTAKEAEIGFILDSMLGQD